MIMSLSKLSTSQFADVMADTDGILVQQQQLCSHGGELISLHADSLCLHGDSPEAVTLAQSLHQALVQQQIIIRAKSFGSPPTEAPWTL